MNSSDFVIKTCSLSALATNEKAASLSELRDKIAKISENSLYYHFWGSRLNTQFEEINYHNDFSKWIYHYLHDAILAEQLSIIDPTEFDSLEDLRQHVLDTIDKRLDVYEIVPWTKQQNSFHFIHSSMIIFDSHLTIKDPRELSFIIPHLPPSSIFYHFIDARMRTNEKSDDFSLWMKNLNHDYSPLITAIGSIDFYFLSLSQIKEQLLQIFKNFFPGN